MAGWREEWMERRDRKLDTPRGIRVCAPRRQSRQRRLAGMEEWKNGGVEGGGMG